MGWEVRGGRWYLYRSRRVDGRPVKEYLGADDPLGLGALRAAELDEERRAAAGARGREAQTRAAYRRQVEQPLALATSANGDLRTVAEGLMAAIGFHRHNRGEWRMRRDLKALKAAINGLEAQLSESRPLVRYDAPADDPAAVELFARARAGDADAQARVQALLRERGWADWLGDLGRQATRQLIAHAAGRDPVWEAGLTAKANALRAELLGERPTVLEELLVRRVVNGWLATHALELELTLRPPAHRRDREHLDKALTRAQRRFAEAARELARVRRLRAPAVLARLTVATGVPAPT